MRTKKRYLLSALFAVLIASLMAFAGCGNNSGESTKPEEPTSTEKPESNLPSQSEEDSTEKVYTVTFDLCTELNTTKISPKKVKYGNRIEKPEVYVIGDNEDNWVITGWYMEETYETEWDFLFDSVEGDTVLYAKWKSDPQYNVRYFAGNAETPTYETKVKKGLTAAECDDRFGGYEVLGYYTSADFTTEYDFATPVTQATDIYVKLSDYIYFTPKFISAFSAHNATAALTADGSAIDVSYTLKDNYIYRGDLDFALNGNELIEIVYKLDGGARVDIYWFASKSDGTPVEGQANFNEVTKNCGLASHYTEITADEDGWTHAVFDLTKPRAYVDGKIKTPLTDIATLKGFRIDVDGETKDPAVLTIKCVKGKQKPPRTGFDVNYHVGEDIVYTDDVTSGEVAVRPADADITLGRKVEGYYTDPEFAAEYDFNAAITGTTDIYVKLSDYFYLDGGMLAKFESIAGATTQLNEDGTLSMKGGNAAFIHKKNLNIALGETNAIEIKVKVTSVGRVDMWVFGEYLLDGVKKESYDYGGDNYTAYYGDSVRCTISPADENGYAIYKFDLTKPFNNDADGKSFAYTVIKGFRIDIVGGDAETNELRIESVKAVENEVTYRVNYYLGSELKGTADVKKGETAPALADEKAAFGKQIIGYYTDEALTEAFDLTSAITANTNLYVKLSDYMYLNGAMLDTFVAVSAGKTLNADGTLTIFGGGYIYIKGINFSLGETVNKIEIRLKTTGRTDIYVFGEYVLDGSAAESNDFGQANTFYRGLTTQGWTTSDAGEGYVIMTYDLAYSENGKPAKELKYNILKGFRIDAPDGTIVDYVKAV